MSRSDWLGWIGWAAGGIDLYLTRHTHRTFTYVDQIASRVGASRVAARDIGLIACSLLYAPLGVVLVWLACDSLIVRLKRRRTHLPGPET
jgi:hypothetical protein